MKSLRYSNQKNPSHWHRNAPQVRTLHSWWQAACPSMSPLQLTKPMGAVVAGSSESRICPPFGQGQRNKLQHSHSATQLTAQENKKTGCWECKFRCREGSADKWRSKIGFFKSLDAIVFYVEGAQTTNRGSTRV